MKNKILEKSSVIFSKHGSYIIIKYILFAVLQFLLFKCLLKGSSTNFALAFMWALVWCNQNIYALSAGLIAAAFAAGLPLLSIAVFAGAAAALCVIYYGHKALKKKLNIWLLNVYLFVSQLLFFMLAAGEIALVARLAINIALTQIFFNAVVNFLQPLLLRKVKLKFGTDEILSALVLVVMLSSGISQVKIMDAYIGAIVLYFLILFITFSFKNFTGVVAASTFGIGFLVAGEGPQMLTAFICFALVAFAFCKVGKIYALAACALTVAAVFFFFKVVSTAVYINAAVPIVAMVFFLLVPAAYFALIKEVFSPQNKTAAESLAFYSRCVMQKKLAGASDCFLAIERVFKKNIKETVDLEEAGKVLKTELMTSVCGKCQRCSVCHNGSDVPATLGRIVNSSLTRGKATILDVPPSLTARCKNVGEIIVSANELTNKYLQFNVLQKNKSVGTEIVTEQMRELSKTVLSLANTMTMKHMFDEKLASVMEAALTYANLPVTQVICEEKTGGKLLVTASFKKGTYLDEKQLESILSKAAKCRLESVQKNAGETAVFEDSFVFESGSPLDAVFGLAADMKTGRKASGDTHSFLKIRGGKVLLCLCDGMGSGAEALRVSTEAIELIEIFTLAGFESGFILESINKLLSLSGGEEFVAIDICALDLFEGTAKFFKLASPESVVAGESGVDIIEGGALPVGAGVTVNAKIEGKVLQAGDILVLMTDGVRDVFAGMAELVTLIETINTTNPQVLADGILSYVKEKNKGALDDDATVMCVRIFEKI